MFLNIVLDDAVEEKDGGEKVKLGMVVCFFSLRILCYLIPGGGRLSAVTRSSCSKH